MTNAELASEVDAPLFVDVPRRKMLFPAELSCGGIKYELKPGSSGKSRNCVRW